MQQREYTLKDWIISIVFLVWFVGSLAALLLTARAGQPAAAVMVFGQYFTVFGVIAAGDQIKKIKAGNAQPIFFLFLLVGLSTFIMAACHQFGDESTKEAVISAIPYVGVGIFFVTGLMLIGNYVFVYVNKSKCTVPVTGTCVKVSVQYKNRGNGTGYQSLYCPIFEYTYGGQIYRKGNGVYLMVKTAEEGDEKQLFINPANPEQFHEEDSAAATGVNSLVLGIFFVIVSTIGIVALGMN
nr:DUF3592 domain-containing protein [Lachnospiraceae bacterium]